jgi:ElaB/YqjD/DUF883 family membrane-anchored ribosome-binding protein
MEQQELGKVPSNVEEIPGRTDTWRTARDKLNETLAGVNEQAKYAAEYADDTVRNNPWTSVGIGFGAGVVVGALIALAASRSYR